MQLHCLPILLHIVIKMLVVACRILYPIISFVDRPRQTAVSPSLRDSLIDNNITVGAMKLVNFGINWQISAIGDSQFNQFSHPSIHRRLISDHIRSSLAIHHTNQSIVNMPRLSSGTACPNLSLSSNSQPLLFQRHLKTHLLKITVCEPSLRRYAYGAIWMNDYCYS